MQDQTGVLGADAFAAALRQVGTRSCGMQLALLSCRHDAHALACDTQHGPRRTTRRAPRNETKRLQTSVNLLPLPTQRSIAAMEAPGDRRVSWAPSRAVLKQTNKPLLRKRSASPCRMSPAQLEQLLQRMCGAASTTTAGEPAAADKRIDLRAFARLIGAQPGPLRSPSCALAPSAAAIRPAGRVFGADRGRPPVSSLLDHSAGSLSRESRP